MALQENLLRKGLSSYLEMSLLTTDFGILSKHSLRYLFRSLKHIFKGSFFLMKNPVQQELMQVSIYCRINNREIILFLIDRHQNYNKLFLYEKTQDCILNCCVVMLIGSRFRENTRPDQLIKD